MDQGKSDRRLVACMLLSGIALPNYWRQSRHESLEPIHLNLESFIPSLLRSDHTHIRR